jgi:HSP20 family protein
MDPIRKIRLRWVHSAFGDVTTQLTRLQLARFGLSPWEPAINAYLCQDSIRICVDLAGVDRSSIDLRVESQRLVLSGTREVPEPADSKGCVVKTIAMEIDHGPFLRIIQLPAGVDIMVDEADAVQENGFLWIHLPLKEQT